MVRETISILYPSLICRKEIVDFGYPQNSETDTLKTYITTESVVSAAIATVRGTFLSTVLNLSVIL
jgi:hypothetical protein